jgi:2-polyprenyl-6-methoxyphenol hydroxylase-like FAD-dependent oxidoreductase
MNTIQSEAEIVQQSSPVTIIGAGILGLMNAMQYAKRGIDVVLIDDVVGQKRSYKVGESLLIFTNPFLRTIGDLDDFLQNSFAKHGVLFVYGAENKTDFESATEWGFQTKLPDRWYAAMPNKKLFRSVFFDAQMVRPEAEDLLLQSVRNHPKITFLDTALVKDVTVSEDETPNTVYWECQHSKRKGVVQTKWIIDCSGRRRYLVKKFNHDIPEVHTDGFKTTAVWAQFANFTDELFDERWTYNYPDAGHTLRDRNTLHFWGIGYWMWLIRLSGDRVSVGVTFESHFAPEGKNYKEQFWNIINRYPLMRDKISEETMLEMRTYKDVQYMTDTFISPKRYVIVGDAASIIDAYYSQGISLALVTSWHAANIIQDELETGKMDRDYLNHVNRATVQDWYMMRHMVRGKFTPAIQDSRFFLLSHILDFTIFTAIGIPRYRLTRWLAETGGDPKAEQPVHTWIRHYLRTRLYLSQTRPWGWLSPEFVQNLQRRWQERLTERALWRLENGVEVKQIKAIVRVNAALPLIGRLFSSKKKVDISPTEFHEPAWLRLRGTELNPIPLSMGGPVYLMLFMGMYFYDMCDTMVRKTLFTLNPGKAKKLKEARMAALTAQTVQPQQLNMLNDRGEDIQETDSQETVPTR